MRIAIVTDAWAPQVNGVGTTLVDLRQRLGAISHEVVVVEPQAFRRVRCPGYPEIELAWRAGDGVRHALEAAQPDAVHVATEGPLGLAARSYCRRRGLPFATAFHSRFPEFLTAAFGIPARWGYAALRRFHAASAGVMVPSSGTMEILRRHGFVNLRRWSHGIDLELFQPNPSARLPWPRAVFLFVGRVSPEKNLEAFLRLELPGSKVVCGAGPMLDRYRREYPGVHWAGSVPRQQLVDFYSAADAFVYPSRTDTFGLVMLEAMACGTPVAAYPVAGPLDVVGSSDGGVLDDDLHRAALRSLAVPRARGSGAGPGVRLGSRLPRVRVLPRADRARRGAAAATGDQPGARSLTGSVRAARAGSRKWRRCRCGRPPSVISMGRSAELKSGFQAGGPSSSAPQRR